MTSLSILHIDASARPGRSGTDPHGSHSRRLSHRFVEGWRAARPQDRVIRRDVGLNPPSPVTGEWIAASFTPPDQRSAEAQAALAESDTLTAELVAADLIVIGVPMYNFGVPAPLKAWIDNVVRVGVTFGFDRARGDQPYWPMLAPGKRLVTLAARGGFGYGEGQPYEHMNLVETGIRTPMAYLGLTEADALAIEYDEFADERLAASIARAEADVDRLVARLAREAGASAAARAEPVPA